ncbi:MAG: helix-turn-helix domain-containing protein [Giesbergeria sp.]
MTKLDAQKLRAVMEAVDSGLSQAEAGRRVGVNAMTVSRWVERERKRVAAEAPAPANEPEKPKPKAKPKAKRKTTEHATPGQEPEEDSLADVLETTKALARELLATGEAAKRAGNWTAAQRALNSAQMAANTIARIERERGRSGNAIHIQPHEIETALELHRRNVRTILAAPILCSDCGRKLRIAWGGGEPDES